MGEPKSRKRKAKTADTEDNETKVLEVPVEEINESEESKPKTKKNKKMKGLEMSKEAVESEVVETKTKKVKKNKVLETSIETLNESELNEVKTKKAKKHKLAEIPTEEVSKNDDGKEKPKKAKKHKLTEITADKGSENDVSKEITKKAKKNKVAGIPSEETSATDESKKKPKKAKKKKDPNPRDVRHKAVPEEIAAQYPVLKDDVLIGKFMAVSVKTHQRTRIRLGLKKKFKGISGPELPDAIHAYMQTILKAPEVSDNDLKRIRMLYSMLKTQLLAPGSLDIEEGKNEGKTAETAKVAQSAKKSQPVPNIDLPEETLARYPVLKDGALVERFMAVDLKNNQKGRIRQILKDSLKGTSDTLLPDVIHTRMQAILKTPELSEPDLRKLRMLYNMLRTSLHTEKPSEKKKKKSVEKKEPNGKKDQEVKETAGDEKNKEQKVKGPKRYVVFVGNLPLDISKETITEHFSDLGDRLKDVRVPKPTEGKKSAIAYLEVADDMSFELALSKHHSMLENRRINVLYSTQQKSKVTKTEAKGKAAKLVAMQKSGKLAGSIPLNKKRSARRNKMKAAQKKEQEAMESGA